MKTVWKFSLGITDLQIISMPASAKILCVQSQKDRICAWAMVDSEEEHISRNVRMLGTGNPISNLEGYQYIGTVQVMGGDLVLHIFIDILDFYKVTASKIFGVKYEEVTSEQRLEAKKASFLQTYGGNRITR